jgi:hypothetical protein
MLLQAEQGVRPIYNWRAAGRRGPPVTIYHKVLAELKNSLQDLTKVVDGAEDERLKNTVKLCLAAINIYDTEEARYKAIVPLLESLLGIDLIEKGTVINNEKIAAHAIAEEAIERTGMKAVIAYFKFKSESGGDFGMQHALGLRSYLARDVVRVS